MIRRAAAYVWAIIFAAVSVNEVSAFCPVVLRSRRGSIVR